MVRGVENLAAMAAAAWLALAPPARADSSGPSICQTRDDKADAAAVDAYVTSSLSEHGQYGFSQPLVSSARAQAKSFFEQHLADKRAELCAAHLKLAEDVKAATQASSGSCGAAAAVTLLEQYAAKAASTYQQNQQSLSTLLNAHVQSLKTQLFNIAKGSTAGVNGTYRGVPLASAPQDVKFEWIKQEATKMGSEAHALWGASSAVANPLVQHHLAIGQEAVRAQQELAAAKAHLQALGGAAACKSAR